MGEGYIKQPKFIESIRTNAGVDQYMILGLSNGSVLQVWNSVRNLKLMN